MSKPELAAVVNAVPADSTPVPEAASEIPPRTSSDAAGKQKETVTVPGPVELADHEPKEGQTVARPPAPELRETERTRPAEAARESKDVAKSLSISISQDKLAVSRREPAAGPLKKGTIDIRSVGRVKSALEDRQEGQAICLSHLTEAQRLAKEGKNDLASEEFESALAVEPNNAIALLSYGSFLLSTNRPVLAEKYLRRGIAVESATKEVKSLLLGNLGMCLFRQELSQDAVTAYQAAIAVDDGNLNAYNNLAIAFKKLGKRELARRTFSRLLVVESKSAMAYYGLGLMNDEDGKLDEAIFHYSRFLVLAGRHHEDLQEKVKKRVEALKAKKEDKIQRKFIHKERYIP
jgi:tetratricopeptide (TPR) repeat protein